jgi:uncharacterized protein (TIRG00374 family)
VNRFPQETVPLEPTQSTTGRRRPFGWLRAAVAAGLLYALFRLVPLDQIGRQLEGARPGPLALVVVLTFAAIAVCALKLHLLLRTGAPGARFLGVLRAYYIGAFFNNFLPTSIGGDVVKVHRLNRQGVPLSHATASVVVERGAGALVLIGAAGAVAAFWGGLFDRLELAPARWPLVALCLATFVALAVMYALWRGRLKDWLKARREGRIAGKLYGFLGSFYLFRHNPGVVAWALVLSAAFYALAAANLALVCLAIGAPLSAVDAAGLTPLSRVPEVLPVSLGGLGVREGALTWCLAHLGQTAAQGAGAALLLRFINWLHSAAGGLLYARTER